MIRAEKIAKFAQNSM